MEQLFLLQKREQGKRIAGIYCGYVPVELLFAMDIVPATLCAFSSSTIEAAETMLPANLCPLIKSSFGFIITDTCPFYGISDVVIGETTCDGKKKMYELISDRKPTYIMDLPQMPDEDEAVSYWTVMIRKLQKFVETLFKVHVLDQQIEDAIKDTNFKNSIMKIIIEYAASKPIAGWSEIYELTLLSQISTGKEMEPLLVSALKRLEERASSGYSHGMKGATRIMITGCPVGGDAQKVFKVIEESGGAIVAIDSCSGLKPFMADIEEDTGDPVRALAEHYLKIPCSCMTPNNRRLSYMTDIIHKYQPDAVIDVVLQACHTYNVESCKAGEYVRKKHEIPFLKIVTDFSQSDLGQMRTRVEALLETCK